MDNNTFCKIEDSNKNKYILTDKNKQPLQCLSVLKSSNSNESEIGSCKIINIKKILDNPTIINNENILPEDTKIPCKVIRNANLKIVDSEPINKSNINFDNYNIASINQNIIIKDVNDRVLDKEIEYNTLYFLDKDNIEDIKKMAPFMKIEIGSKEFNKEIYFESMNKMYNYKQKLFIKEDISNNPILNPNSNPNPSENNNMLMYIGIGLGIFFSLLLLYAFLYYKKKSNINDVVGTNIDTDASNVSNANISKNYLPV
jgi:hypothetical protein